MSNLLRILQMRISKSKRNRIIAYLFTCYTILLIYLVFKEPATITLNLILLFVIGPLLGSLVLILHKPK
jgi:sugar phosphate permease